MKIGQCFAILEIPQCPAPSLMKISRQEKKGERLSFSYLMWMYLSTQYCCGKNDMRETILLKKNIEKERKIVHMKQRKYKFTSFQEHPFNAVNLL